MNGAGVTRMSCIMCSPCGQSAASCPRTLVSERVENWSVSSRQGACFPRAFSGSPLPVTRLSICTGQRQSRRRIMPGAIEDLALGWRISCGARRGSCAQRDGKPANTLVNTTSVDNSSRSRYSIAFAPKLDVPMTSFGATSIGTSRSAMILPPSGQISNNHFVCTISGTTSSMSGLNGASCTDYGIGYARECTKHTVTLTRQEVASIQPTMTRVSPCNT